MKFKWISFIRILIVLLFIAALSCNVYQTFDVFYFFGERLTFDNFYLKYRLSLFLLFPFIGVFLKNRIGWICITHYFYFVFFNMLIFIKSNKSELQDLEFVFFIFGVVLILSCFVIIMNKKVITDYYKIPKKDILPNNIFASVMAFSVALILVAIQA